MTTPLTPAELDEARALVAADPRTLHVVDDEATCSMCISEGETYLARDSYLTSNYRALKRESLEALRRIVDRWNTHARLLATVSARDAEIERLTRERDDANASLQYIEDRDARVLRELWDEVASLRAMLEVDEPAEEPTEIVVAGIAYQGAYMKCECCGADIERGDRMAIWRDDKGRLVAFAHAGPCPEPDMCRVEYTYNGEPRSTSEISERQALEFGANLNIGGAAGISNVRLLRIRRGAAP